MRPSELLILNYDGFNDRVEALFEQLTTSPSARELFLKDPASLVAKVVLPSGDQPRAAELAQANRILFSLLSNPKFIAWAKEFREELDSEIKQAAELDDPAEALKHLAVVLDRPEIYRRITSAAVKYCDKELMHNLLLPGPLTRGATNPAQPALSEAQLRRDDNVFVLASAVVAIFAVALGVGVVFLVLGAEYAPEGISRQDLRTVSTLISKDLAARAKAAKRSGALLSAGPMVDE
jgi:hypothetical protein